MEQNQLQNSGLKKQLLQKLMMNLLNKPGRSVHELMNGIKDAIGAYKNYAKEWDNLTMMGGVSAPGAVPGVKSGVDVQKILQGIQQKKTGAAGAPTSMPPMPNMPTSQATPALPPMNTPQPIAGQPQQSNINKSAPVSNLGMWGY